MVIHRQGLSLFTARFIKQVNFLNYFDASMEILSLHNLAVPCRYISTAKRYS
jgi:hypothetical protein